MGNGTVTLRAGARKPWTIWIINPNRECGFLIMTRLRSLCFRKKDGLIPDTGENTDNELIVWLLLLLISSHYVKETKDILF